MSNKKKAFSVKEEAKSALVPKLRFPGFRQAEGWASEPLDEVYSFGGNNSLSRDKLNYVAGSVRNIHYGDIHTKFSTHFDITRELVPYINESEESAGRDESLCAEGDMIFADASEDMADIGKSIEIINLDGERVVSGLHTILARRINDRIVLGFGGHLFKSGWVRSQIQKEAQGAKVLGISPTRLRNLRLPLPKDKAEQHKIAECLSSLDELMSAQARKVTALKAHKKGLMQQLFPREGEAKPRLRFPEFQSAGDWVEMKLGEKVDLLSGYPFDGSDISMDSTGIPLLRGINVTEGRIRHNADIDRYYTGSTEGLEKFILHANDLVIGMDGSKVGKNSALITTADAGALLIQRVARLRAKKASLAKFIFQRINSPSFHAYVDRINTSSGIPHISAKQIKEFRIFFPSDEEQRHIVSCLSSLDALVAAEAEKLESLKAHKKGLVQQVFPSPEAVEA